MESIRLSSSDNSDYAVKKLMSEIEKLNGYLKDTSDMYMGVEFQLNLHRDIIHKLMSIPILSWWIKRVVNRMGVYSTVIKKGKYTEIVSYKYYSLLKDE